MSSVSGSSIALLIGATILFALFLYYMGPVRQRVASVPAPAPAPWIKPSEQSAYANVNDRITAWSRSWRLPVPNNGAFKFHVKSVQNSGLVIGLQNTAVDADSWATSGEGYGIVLDNRSANMPLSWVGKLPYFNKEAPSTRRNIGFILQPGWYWVSVQNGRITVGNEQKTILDVTDPTPVNNIQYFGFGAFNGRLGTEKPGVEIDEISIKPN